MLSDLVDEVQSFSTTQRVSLPELVALASVARALAVEYEALGVEPEQWLEDNTKAIRREIKSRNADRLQAKLKSAIVRRESLKTPDEKRNALDAEIKNLEKQLSEA